MKTKKSQLIKRLYLKENLSQRDIAKKLNISRGQVRYYLDGIKKSKEQIKQSMKRTLFQEGNKINLGKQNALGYKFNEKQLEKRTGEKNPVWKGDNVGYHALHSWIKHRKSKPKLCEDCKKEKKLELANISGEYKRDINDFKWLCYSCHSKMDFPNGLIGRNLK